MRTRLLWLLIAATLLAAAPGRCELPVSGRAESDDGKPIADATVRLLPVRDAYQTGLDLLAGRLEPDAAAEVTTGDDGRFRLSAPEAGLWRVRLEAEGYVPMETRLQPLIEPTTLPPVRLAESQPLTVVVRDPRGRPVAGAAVAVSSRSRRLWRSPFNDDSGWRRPPSLGLTGADGQIVLPRATGQRVEGHAFSTGFAPAEPEESSAKRLELKLAEGRPTGVLVRDANERPVAGALLLVGSQPWATGVTDEDGGLTGILPLEETVTVVTASGARGQARTTKTPETLTLTLTEPRVVAGLVIDADSRRPLAGALVWAAGDSREIARSDGSGGFRLPTNRKGGPSLLRAAAPGYFAGRLQVTAAQSFAPVIALRPAASATGVVVDAGGVPLAGADLTARFVPDGSRGFRSGSGGQANATSEEDGSFRLTPLTPDLPLRLEARASGFATTDQDLEPLTAHEERAGLRLQLQRGASLSGRITAAGEPLAGAEARAMEEPKSSSPMAVFDRRGSSKEQSEQADDRGAFLFADLSAGSYRVTVSAPGFASQLLPGIEVEAGGTDLGVIELEPGVEIHGLVVDDEERPVASAEVRASSKAFGALRMMGRTDGEEPALSGADGSFAIADRRRGERVDLEVSHRDHQMATAPGIEVPNTEPVRIVLQRAARIRGMVVDPVGAPVPQAMVSAMVEEARGANPSRSAAGFRYPVIASSDEAGHFELEQVPAGKLRLVASAQGWRSSKVSPLELTAGEEREGVRLVLQRGGAVSGRVLESDGQPAIGARVWVEVERRMRFMRGNSAATDGEGRYLLQGVEPGTRLINARNQEGATAAREIEVAPGTIQLDLQFAGGVEISGRVVDGAGAPLANASVAAMTSAQSWGGATGRSGSDGTFTIEGVRDGQYLLRATREGYGTRILDEPLQVAGVAITGIELVLESGGSIRGAVLGLEESQLPLVGVFASSGESQWAIGQVSHDGTYRIPDLAAGDWYVRAAVPQGAQAQGRVTLAGGATEVTLDLDFSSGLVVTGQVLRSGQPLSGLRVHLRGLEASGWFGSETDHDGRFRIEGIEPGPYRLEVLDFNRGVLHREEVDLDGDRDLLVEVLTGRVAGRVLDVDDLRPMAGAEATLELADEDDKGTGYTGWFGRVTSDEQGRFVIPEVVAADYRLQVVKEGYAPAELPLSVTPGADLADIEVLLESTSGLRLRVLGTSGSPVSHVYYAVLDAAGRALTGGRRPANESGYVRLPSVPEGRFELLLAAPGAAVRRLEVEPGGPPVTVGLEPSCRLEVEVPALLEEGTLGTMRITGGDGVQFQSLDWGRVEREWQIHGGSRTVEGLPAGSYNVEVTAPDGNSWQSSVRVVPGATTRLTL